MRRGSTYSVQSLEDLLMCPIHMDLLEDARTLPCGHVFCLKCLQQLPSNRLVECPMCRERHPVPSAGVAAFPIMYTQNRLVQYVTEKKQQHALRSLQEGEDMSPPSSARRGRSFSIATKTDILKRLVEDISSHQPQSSVDQASRSMCIAELNTLLQSLQRQCVPSTQEGTNTRLEDDQQSTDSNLTTSSTAEMHAVDHQRRFMHKNCVYKRDVLLDTRSHLDGVKVACVDFLDDDNKVTQDRFTAVILDATGTRMFVLTKNGASVQVKPLQVRHGSCDPFVVTYLQCLRGCVHVCGEFSRPAGCFGLMLQCDINGRVLSRSIEITARQPVGANASGHHHSHPAICGFYYDSSAKEYVVARPSEGKISLWSEDYRSKYDYNFDWQETHPYYVVRVHANHELWLSCPKENTIVILDETTSVWKKLDTSAIYNSVPGHLTITTDDRVIFVDRREQRLFWLTRMGNNLPVQRLVFRRINFGRLLIRQNEHMACVRGLFGNQLLVATESYILVFRPGGSVDSCECTVL